MIIGLRLTDAGSGPERNGQDPTITIITLPVSFCFCNYNVYDINQCIRFYYLLFRLGIICSGGPLYPTKVVLNRTKFSKQLRNFNLKLKVVVHLFPKLQSHLEILCVAITHVCLCSVFYYFVLLLFNAVVLDFLFWALLEENKYEGQSKSNEPC